MQDAHKFFSVIDGNKPQVLRCMYSTSTEKDHAIFF